MQQPTTAPETLPRYRDWLTTDAVADQVGTSSMVVNGWIVTGVKIEAGRIRLRAVKIGGRWRIEEAAVREFIAATTTAALPKSATATPVEAGPPLMTESAAKRAKRVKECDARLREKGVWIDQ